MVQYNRPARDGLKNELFPLRVLRQSAEWIERFSYLFSERRKQKRALRRSFYALQELLRVAFQRGGQFQ